MGRKSLPWFRFYVEAIDDLKLVRHPPAVCWLWTVILAQARTSPIAGLLLISEGTSHTVDTLAAKSRVPAKTVKAALGEFERDGMLGWDEHLKCWQVVNFTERQYESDCSTERVRQYRSKLREGNKDETFQ